VSPQYHPHLSETGSDGELAALAAQVSRAVRQTGQMNQAVTRVAAELQSLTGEIDVLAGEVGALAAEGDQESAVGIVPGARSAPDDQPSH
jgi:hypothetical protein